MTSAVSLTSIRESRWAQTDRQIFKYSGPLIHLRRAFVLALVLGLSGCGAEVAGTAAVVGTAKVKEAEQAQKQQEQIRQRLDAAAGLDRQRRAAAEGQ